MPVAAMVRSSAFAAIHGMRRDSLLLELKLTLKIAQRNVILKDPGLFCLRIGWSNVSWL